MKPDQRGGKVRFKNETLSFNKPSKGGFRTVEGRITTRPGDISQRGEMVKAAKVSRILTKRKQEGRQK